MSLLLSQTQISDRVDALAERLCLNMPQELTCVILMDGAMVFASDLLRALYKGGLNPRVLSLGLSSYGNMRETSGNVKITADLPRDITGENILILDDVLESGHTLAFAQTYMKAKGAASVQSCIFAQKPYENARAKAEYIGWQAPDEFLIGYGLDDAGYYRGQPYISAVEG